MNLSKFAQFLFVCTSFAAFTENNSYEIESNFIEVEKKNVLYKFVRFDPPTDDFTQHAFPTWEDDTFEVFNRVKDPNAIAIDLGAWIGTTAIWLSKNFHHVIAVDADRESIKCLRLNLEASQCPNVTICDKAIMHTSQDVVFGPRCFFPIEWISYAQLNGVVFGQTGFFLNASTSCAKLQVDNPFDYVTKSITLKQLVRDIIYANKELNSHKISFIKCDIEGGEENILEDVLLFALDNKCSVHMSFHISWWTSKKITDFDYLFEHFNTDASIHNISSFLQANPFAALLLEPK